MKVWMALLVATGLALGLAVVGGVWLSVSKQAIKSVLRDRADREISSRDLPMSEPDVPRTVSSITPVRYKPRKNRFLGYYFSPKGAPGRWHPEDGGLAYIEVSASGELIAATPIKYEGQCWHSGEGLRRQLSRVDFSNPPIPDGAKVYRAVIHAGCPVLWSCGLQILPNPDLWPYVEKQDSWPLNTSHSIWEPSKKPDLRSL